MLVTFAQFINKLKLFTDYFVNMYVFYNNLKLFYKIYPVSKYKKASQIYILRRFKADIQSMQLLIFHIHDFGYTCGMSASLKFCVQEQVNYIDSKPRADNPRAHTKHVGVIVHSCHTCGKSI